MLWRFVHEPEGRSTNRSIALLAPMAVPLVALVAGCGGGGGGGATAAVAPAKTSSGRPATVGVATSGLGKILVDSKGRTVYLFMKDQGTKSSCFGGCASNWPPLRVSGKPTVGKGVQASKLSTNKRSDGNRQVTYDGHPLYLFVGDQQAGNTSGQGVSAFGGAWYVLAPSGNEITSKPANPGGTNSRGGY
jgi:predicted lipoprotein with Yx(FWY)xxD motif